MIEKIDYSKYLSIDNGKGLLISRNDAYVLDCYGINYVGISNLNELIFLIGSYIDDNYDSELDDLEEVLSHLMELHYYYETKK